MKKILISPNAYKGTLLPSQAASLIEKEFKKKKIPCVVHPLADGGDGTLDVLSFAFKAKKQLTRVTGPLGKKVWAEWRLATHPITKRRIALLETAKASGLALVKGKKKPLLASSMGTGQLIRAALNKKCQDIYIGVGGTASSDGGAGALQALGFQYRDKRNKLLAANPVSLLSLHHVHKKNVDSRLKKARMTVLCDVKNKLLGRHGSARTFSPQKGATPQQVGRIEKFLTHWARFARFQTKNKPGAGAAGALAFGLSGFLGAKLVQGAPFIMKMTGWGLKLPHVSAIITGEGRLDRTSFQGKVVGMILRNRKSRPVYVVCGSNTLSKSELRRKGISEAFSMGPRGMQKPHTEMAKTAKKLVKYVST